MTAVANPVVPTTTRPSVRRRIGRGRLVRQPRRAAADGRLDRDQRPSSRPSERRSSIAADRIVADRVGHVLAAMSGADPWIGS